jgi:hypothetical protein
VRFLLALAGQVQELGSDFAMIAALGCFQARWDPNSGADQLLGAVVDWEWILVIENC